ncbi:uncharacterized protein LOC129729422 [Wyeomyia smithii]|uniref:uncharacterized protein LOC129729422 n=1 Tax=Wyeomyia smithii TaxID=174621 RepID=UPI002467DF53|nr:uncharacterized protein LOC129729422 [Wyeomyia smithii]
MTLSARRRPASAAFANYEQRRRRNQRFVRSFSSQHAVRDLVQRDSNNNNVSFEERKRYQIGAFIYRKISGAQPLESQLSLHVFENHRVQVRHTEKENQAVKRLAGEYSTVAVGKKTFINSFYMVQKYVPVHYSSCCLGEKQYRVSLNFQRKYVPMFEHEYQPIEDKNNCEMNTYRSVVTLNVL